MILAALALGLDAGPASAHANLVTAAPGLNENLDRSPVLIELYFSEPVEGNFSKIQVLDSTGKRVDNDDSAVDAANPTRLTATIRSLPDGIYTVTWKALSLVDSHITEGAYPFAVGDVDAAALDAAAAASQQINLSFGEVLFRWLSYLSGAALAGSVLFRSFVWEPAVAAVFPDREDAPNAPWRRLTEAALILLLAANVLGLLFQTGQVVGQEVAAPWHPAITRLLFATRYGALWLIRFVMALTAAYFLLDARRPRDRWVALGAALVVMLTFSLNSHAAAEPQAFFPILGDWLHLLGASFWMGSLVFFAGGLLAARQLTPTQRTSLTANMLPRFSALAMSSVGLLALAGLYSAVLRLGSFEALTTTLYGRLLVVKSLLFLPAVSLGAVNLLFTTPIMKRAAAAGGDAALAERFRLLVTVEIAILTVLLIAAGVFTAVPPARAIATESTLEVQAEEDDLSISLVISPGKVGLNDFFVLLATESGPLVGAKEVVLQFVPTTVDLPPSEVVLEENGEGEYFASGGYLSLPDEWQVQVAVRREGVFDTFANFSLPVGTSASQNYPWNRAAAALLLAAGLAYFFAARGLNQPEAQRVYLTRVPAAALLGAAVMVYFLPTGVEERYINPVPPNQASIAEGQAIYRVQCLSCHGPNGRGDGPVGLTLNPPPADLYAHTQPGVHPDGRLYEWITFGFSDDQVMPKFEKILTDEERWHVVNYIRTFSGAPDEAAP